MIIEIVIYKKIAIFDTYISLIIALLINKMIMLHNAHEQKWYLTRIASN